MFLTGNAGSDVSVQLQTAKTIANGPFCPTIQQMPF
jgi:hypothetical protein